MGIRAWTHGYDLYAPQSSVLFHEYAQMSSRRRHVPKFYEAKNKHRSDGRKSLKRLTALIGMAPVGQGDDWDHTKEALYGLGSERPVELFYKLALVDVAKRSAVPLCQFIHTGDMHCLLHDAYLRPDGRGIDYSGAAQNVDVMGVIDRRLYTPITTMLKRAQSTGNVNGARSALSEAQRTKLVEHHPELGGLVEEVRKIH